MSGKGRDEHDTDAGGLWPVNGETFAQLFDHQYPRVYHYLLWRLRDRHAAEQAIAQVFAIALSTFQNGTRPEHAGSRLVTIAEDVAGFMREKHVEETSSQPDAEGEIDPEELAVRRLEGETIRRCMEELTPEHRQILLLRIIAGLSLREVAKLLGMTEDAVRAVQFRALAALAHRLQEVETHAEPYDAAAR